MVLSTAFLGAVTVQTTNNRGFTPEELAERTVNRIVHISEGLSPEANAQAVVYKDTITAVVISCMKQAINSYKTTLNAELINSGRSDIAQIVNKI